MQRGNKSCVQGKQKRKPLFLAVTEHLRGICKGERSLYAAWGKTAMCSSRAGQALSGRDGEVLTPLWTHPWAITGVVPIPSCWSDTKEDC